MIGVEVPVVQVSEIPVVAVPRLKARFMNVPGVDVLRAEVPVVKTLPGRDNSGAEAPATAAKNVNYQITITFQLKTYIPVYYIT